MVEVYVSIGSNIDREKNVLAALSVLTEAYGELARSSVYESKAVGFDSAPFYNLVVGFKTDNSPQSVHEHLHVIEDRQGRQRTAALSARTLDLDLLLYGERVMQDNNLMLPRDDIERYAFVLCPLAEIAGEVLHPVTGARFADMWAAFPDAVQTLTRIDWPPVAQRTGA